MTKSILPLLLATLAASCGGRVDEPPGQQLADSGSASDSTPTPNDAIGDTTGPLCSLSNGVPVCESAGCPAVDGCDACGTFGDRDLNRAPFGVCSGDVPKVLSSIDGHGFTCALCPDADDLCVFEGFDYTCAKRPLCDAFVRAGFKGCFFQDMTDYSLAAIEAGRCPRPGSGLCGGDCGGCGAGEVCIGRSPTHPFGVCSPLRSGDGNYQTACWHHPENSAQACRSTTDECVVFKSSDAAAQKAADEHGVCVPPGRCRAVRDVIPGGVNCVDAAGHDLP